MSGRFGAVDLAAATNTTVMTGAAGVVSTVTLRVANRNTTAVVIRLAHVDGAVGTLSAEDYILYGHTLLPGGVFHDSGIVVAPGHEIVAYSDTANVSVQAWGWEDVI